MSSNEEGRRRGTRPKLAEAPWLVEFPFESRWFEVEGGHRMHHVDEGPHKGTAVLCVHGNPTWSFYWRRLIAATRTQRRIIAADHIGMGLSDKPSERDYPYRLHRRIDDLEALWRHLGEPAFDLVAYDWGGPIGLGLAQRHPGKVRRITLLNTAAYVDADIPKRIALCRMGPLGRLIVRGFNGFAGPAVRFATSHKGGLPARARAGLLHPYRSWADRVAVHEFVRDIPMEASHPSRPTLAEIEAGLPKLGEGRRIQLLWGRDDFCFHEHFLKRFVQIWPKAQVDRLDGVGHYVMEDAPDEAVRRIREFQERD